MTTYSLFELEPIFIDFKNESYNLGLDIQANQNDTLTLNFICRNNGIEEDMSKYKVELRVHNNNTNTDYIQTQNENVTLSADGSVKIVCQSLKGNKLTAYSGQCNGVLRIFNTENKQKATRIITMRIVADPLEAGKANICESTITKLEDLDWILNEAYNIEDEFKKAIEEAIKQKAELTTKISESVTAKNNLNSTIQTANNTNKTLTDTNTTAINTKNELNTLNTTANTTKSNLDKSNVTALGTNKTLTDTNTTAINTNSTLNTTINNANKSKTDLDTSKNNADKSKSALDGSVTTGNTLKTNLDNSISTGTTLKNDIDNRLITGNKLKTDIDNSSTIATTKKEQLDSANVQATKNIETLNSFGDASQLTKDVTTLKTKVLENTLTTIETDSTLTKLESCKDSFVHNMHIKGKTLQNLCVENNFTIEVPTTNFGYVNKKLSFNLSPNKTYTISFEIENSGTGVGFSSISLGKRDNNGDTWSLRLINDNSLKSGKWTKTFTLPSTFEPTIDNYIKFIFEARDCNGKISIKNIMLLEGEPKELPSYFEGIKSTGELEGNKISILTKSKNLCSINSLRFSKQENTGRFFKINKLPKGKYKLKYNGTDKYLAFYYYIEGGASFYRDKEEILTIQHDEYKELRLYIDADRYDDNSTRKYDDIVISRVEDGDFKYEPSKEDKTEILLPSPHMGLPNGTSDVIDYEKNERIKNVIKYILNGSVDENWMLMSSDTKTIRFVCKINTVKSQTNINTINVISDTLQNKTQLQLGMSDEEGVSSHNEFSVQTRVQKEKLETPDASGIRKYLQKNNIPVYCELANPVVEKLNIKDTLQTFENGYIQLDNAITPTTQLEYSTNLPSALGGLAEVTDKLVDDVTNVEITISDMDAELGDEPLKTTSETIRGAINENMKNIDNKFNRCTSWIERDINPINLECGHYMVEGNLKASNGYPIDGYWNYSIIVSGDKSDTAQVGHKKIILIERIGTVYIKTQDSDIWSQWKQIATTENQFNKGQYTGNLDDLIEPGSYGIVRDKTTGTPVNEWGSIIVQQYPDKNAVYQIAMFLNRTTYVRYSYYDGISTRLWTEWKQLSTTETKTLTLLNGWQTQIGDTKIYRNGNVVTLNLVLSGGATVTGSSIGKLPEGFRPSTDKFISFKSCSTDYNYNTNGHVIIYSSGDINLDSSVTYNTRLVLNASFGI